MAQVTSSIGVVIWKLSHHVAAGPSNRCAANLTFSASVQPTVTKSLFTERNQSLATMGSVVPANFAGLKRRNLVSISKTRGLLLLLLLLGSLLLLLLFWFWINVVIICISWVCAFIICCISGVMLLGLGFARRGGICGLFK